MQLAPQKRMTPPSELIQNVLSSDLIDDPTRSAAREPARVAPTVQRRRHWGIQAWLAATVLGATGVFIATTHTIHNQNGSPLDRAVVRTVGRARHPAVNGIARGLTSLGSVPGAGAVALGAVVLGRHRPRLSMQIAVGALGGICAELVLKRMFRRQRPKLLAHLEHVSSSSFPSGHAMASSALYLTVAFVASRSRVLRSRRGSLLTGAAVLATCIGASRVYLGVHWPTDVLGGLALGTAWACTAEAAFNLSGARLLEESAATTR